MKPEDRERLFSQVNSTMNGEIFSRLSKEERDRFLATAFYNQQQPNPYNFHQYSWTTQLPSSTTVASSSILIPPIPSTATDQQQQQQPRSPNSDDSGNQSNSGSTTEW